MMQSPRGTRDLLPEDQPYWQFVLKTAALKAGQFGFDLITLPTFEDERIFTKAIGTGTDIVDKELFRIARSSNTDETKVQLALRPEGTAGAIRAYMERGMATWSQPVKLWYAGSMYRYDRPQKGRYREFFQMGAELIGDESAAADALMILFSWQIIESLGLADAVVVDINTIGDKVCRPKIKKTLTAYFSAQKNKLCDDCKKRLTTNPLRVLDCKEASCQPIIDGAPSILDIVDNDCKEHFRLVLDYIDDLNIPYDLNPRLVRGLDYYTRTTFEFREKDDARRQGSLGGGGRYDGLIELYGGKSTPAIGFALGLDRIVELLKERNIPLPETPQPDFCVIQLGDKARKLALSVIKDLTQAGYTVITAPGKDALKGQMRLANKVNARFAIIIGQKEAFDNTVILKNLDDSSQETIPRTRLLAFLTKRLPR